VLPRDEAGEEGDQGSIGPGEPGTGDLSPQHGQLVAQHEYLGVLGGWFHPMDADQPDDAANRAVKEGKRHELRAWPSTSWLVKPGRE
jgi:hypothetical protein